VLCRSRDPRPLGAGWLTAFVLAARAGLTTAFPRERLDGRWPDARLVLLPAPLASTTSSLLHVRTSWWSGAADHFARGGSVYVSCSADVAIPEMAPLLGARIADRAPANVPPVLRFVRPWGPFAPDDALVLPPGDGTLESRSVVLAQAGGSSVIAVDASGAPALIVAERGAGRSVVCAHPVELLLARQPDAHGPGDRSWGLYAGLAAATGTAEAAAATHPDVTSGLLAGPAGALLALTNHAPDPVDATIRLPGHAARVRRFGPDGSAGLPSEPNATALTLAPHGAAIIGWDNGTAKR
jgi:beta-galactosidase